MDDADALALADAPVEHVSHLLERAAAVRDRVFGKVVTFSPKVFLPLTNLCRNRCDYCAFRRSSGDEGEYTMSPQDVDAWLSRAHDEGCVEALFCLGDKPESSFPAYRRTLQSFGHDGTVDYLHASGVRALERGLLPHTNAGILTADDMKRLKEVNVSLGLMLECSSARLCQPGMPHHRAPDKRPARRVQMIAEAGALQIPFTTGILIGIGETLRERIESLLAIRALHREFGHIQEVIVQNFRAHEGTPMAHASEPNEQEVAHAVALARLILDEEVSVQAPPNLNAESIALLLRAGVNDFGGISPLTPDFINVRLPWPHLDALEGACAREGFTLRPRLPIYPRWLDRPGFLVDSLRAKTLDARARLDGIEHPSQLPRVKPASSALPLPRTKSPLEPRA